MASAGCTQKHAMSFGHSIHSERTNWTARVTQILKSGEAQQFQTFDRWGQQRAVQNKSLTELLDEFKSVGPHNLQELRALNLNTGQLELRANG